MIKTSRRFWDTLVVPVKDMRFLLWVAAITAALYLLDPEGLNVMRIILYTIMFWMLSICIRKAMMPYRRDSEDGHRVQMKLSYFMRQALKGNVAAAIISIGILFLQALIAFSFIIWLR